jgi:hypothetical protein
MRMLAAALVAAASAAAILVACAFLGRRSAALVATGWVLGLAGGFYAGLFVLDLNPNWPPREVHERFLFILFPACLAVELLVIWLHPPKWFGWCLRLLIATATAPVLLYQTIYLADLAGPGSREWTVAQAAAILAALGAGVSVVWAGLTACARRVSGSSILLALSLVCGAAGISVMYSGYLSAGQLGLPLAGALGGMAVVSPALRGGAACISAVGPGVVGLSCLVMLGRFFGELSTPLAAILFGAPLLCWLVEAPPLLRLPHRMRVAVRILVVAVPAALALTQARGKAEQASGPPDGSSDHSASDYSAFQP